MKLTAEERAWKNAEAGLQNAQDQVEDQCKKFYHTEIELVTAKQQAPELKAKLQTRKLLGRPRKLQRLWSRHPMIVGCKKLKSEWQRS